MGIKETFNSSQDSLTHKPSVGKEHSTTRLLYEGAGRLLGRQILFFILTEQQGLSYWLNCKADLNGILKKTKIIFMCCNWK